LDHGSVEIGLQIYLLIDNDLMKAGRERENRKERNYENGRNTQTQLFQLKIFEFLIRDSIQVLVLGLLFWQQFERLLI